MRPATASGARVAHYLSLAAALPLLLNLARSQWFFLDEWDFLTNRGFGGARLELFVPHNEHWSTLPILVYRALFAVFALRTYAPYLAVLLVVHIAAAHLLWRLMRRGGADPWVATALSALFLVLGTAYENLLWAFQIGFVGSLALGLAATLIAEQGSADLRRLTGTWLLLVASLMCSGVGLAMVVFAALCAGLRRGPSALLITASVPVIAYISWFAAIGHQGLGTILTISELEQLPAYVAIAVSSAAGGLAGFTELGGGIAVGLVLWFVTQRHDARLQPVAISGAVAAASYSLIGGIARAGTAIGEAGSPRHIYIAGALLLPAVAWIVSTVARRDLVAQVLSVALTMFCAAENLAQLVAHAQSGLTANHEVTAGDRSKLQILAAAKLLDNIPAIGTTPDPAAAPLLTLAQLRQLSMDGDLPVADHLSDFAEFSARAALQTSFASSRALPAATVNVTAAGNALVFSEGPGCTGIMSSTGSPDAVEVRFDTRGSIAVTSADATTLQLGMRVSSDTGLKAAPIPLTLASGQTKYLNVLLADADPVVVSPGAQITICGAGA